MKTLIKNGWIITADDAYQADVFIGCEIVTAIGESFAMQTDAIIDAYG